MSRILVVTNDFPPRQGGIQSFVAGVLEQFDPAEVVVYTSSYDGDSTYDEAAPYPIIRDRSSMLLPTRRVTARAVDVLRQHGCDAVWFGAAAPLGLMAPALRRAGARRLVGTTHGHEIGWAALPGARQMLRRIGRNVDVVTYLGEYTRARLARALPAGVRLEQLTPGVDVTRFRSDVDGTAVRERYGLQGRRVVVCVSRLVPRKGQDVLIDAWPAVRSAVPDAALLLVGGGSEQDALEKRAAERGVAESVVVTGGVPYRELPAHFAAGDVFAMPCRTRWRGFDVEGLGIVYLEASATGLPVIAGDSGGAPDAVLPGETGVVVDGTDVDATAGAMIALLTDTARATAMGQRGRAWVEERWQWHQIAERLRGWLFDA
ncbi:MAG: alpha-(1-2)-phosphatidylinositol mannosyltransferase [Frankiales bacterium]|nr:alpha-(1-2)-phosphatidylinositol mannosyltransferase [Frankiales bacterium]